MLDITQRGEVTLVTMKHGRANTQDTAFCREIIRCFEELEKTDTRAVVLTGQDGIFSAGVDLVQLTEGGAEYVREFLPPLSQMFETVFFFPKPVVSAVNGHAIAGGCVLACCTDYRLMSQGNGRIGVPELLVGVPFPAVALEVMRYVTTPPHLDELIYTGVTVRPPEAQQYGLVNAVVEPAQLLDEALKFATNLAARPPAAFAQTKAQLHAPVRAFLKENAAGINAEILEQWASSATLDTIRAYIARTFKKAQ